jgi:hypothetical protein
MRRTLACLVLASSIGGASAIAQTQTQNEGVQQLQDKVKQLEQLTEELKARLATLEKSQPGTPQIVNTNATTPAAPQNAPSPKAAPESNPIATPGHEVVVATQPATSAPAQGARDKEEPEPRMDIYGFAMLDMGYDFGQNDPAWFDVMRPTKLPAFTNQFGFDGRFYTGVRQSRFGVKGYLPTPLGELKTIFEVELFGVGVDAGQTTFRLRHAWGELGQIGAGQTWSPFMDPDVFPNSLEYWGPNGMVFFRNVQLRWMPINKGNHQLWIALERPGASGDLGVLSGRVELQGVQARFPAPDVSARFRWGGERDYVQIAGMGRYIAWDDLTRSVTRDLGGHLWGWGVNASSNVGVGKKDAIKMQVVYGHGIENYMNDAPSDVAAVVNVGNVRTPVTGATLPVLGVVGFYDRYWSDRWSSSVGYSLVRIDNVALQNASEFHKGQYGLFNLLFYPAKNVMMGGEFQWGRRDNFRDGFSFDDYRIQFGFKYNFDYKLGGNKK